MFGRVLRYPTPGKGPVDLSEYGGEKGLSHCIIADLQRIVACLDMAEDPIPDPEYILIVAKESNLFSSKVVMPMSAQSEWRLVSVCQL